MTKEEFANDVSKLEGDALRVYLGTLQSNLGLGSIEAVYKHYGLEKPQVQVQEVVKEDKPTKWKS